MTDLVVAALVAGPLTAGQPGYLGVQYTIKPGWHIYWENPGQTGIPTEITFQDLPAGVQTQPTQYPGPHSFMMPGDLINYGYEDAATLLVPVTIEGEPQGTITAKSRWLVCREEQCVPGKAELSLDLSAAGGLDLAAAQAHLPAPLPEGAAQRSASGVTVTLPGAQIEEAFADLAAEPAVLQTAVQGERARIWLKEPAESGSGVVLRVSEGGAERFYRVAL